MELLISFFIYPTIYNIFSIREIEVFQNTQKNCNAKQKNLLFQTITGGQIKKYDIETIKIKKKIKR